MQQHHAAPEGDGAHGHNKMASWSGSVRTWWAERGHVDRAAGADDVVDGGADGHGRSKIICKGCDTVEARGSSLCPLVAIAMATTSRHMAERVENPGKKVPLRGTAWRHPCRRRRRRRRRTDDY